MGKGTDVLSQPSTSVFFFWPPCGGCTLLLGGSTITTGVFSTPIRQMLLPG